MSNLLKNLLFGLGLVTLLFLGYQVFFVASDDELLSTSGDSAAQQAEQQTQEFLTRLQELSAVKINDAVFNDPRFVSLVDFRQAITEEPTGRTNPFAPVR